MGESVLINPSLASARTVDRCICLLHEKASKSPGTCLAQLTPARYEANWVSCLQSWFPHPNRAHFLLTTQNWSTPNCTAVTRWERPSQALCAGRGTPACNSPTPETQFPLPGKPLQQQQEKSHHHALHQRNNPNLVLMRSCPST